jgi:hypothetical protein
MTPRHDAGFTSNQQKLNIVPSAEHVARSVGSSLVMLERMIAVQKKSS